jgi:hypothetical protein
MKKVYVVRTVNGGEIHVSYELQWREGIAASKVVQDPHT